jgi:peptide chain release factor 3
MERTRGEYLQEGITCSGLDDPKLDQLLPESAVAKLREDVAMVRGLCPKFDLELYLAGHLTPVFFGSAVNNFGVKELLTGIAELAPPPRPQPTRERLVLPSEPKVAGFVFKIQANMDPKHRDRVAFVRLASGKFTRGMRLTNPRTGKALGVHNAMVFQANERELAEEAWAGDIIGIPNHGTLRIGDALTEGEVLHFTGIPSYAPEFLRRVRADDPMKAKHLGRALEQLAEEGAAQVFRLFLGSDFVVGVVGALQFDVLADRIRSEYDLPCHFEATAYEVARWVDGDDAKQIKRFADANRDNIAEDHSGATVFLARNEWQLGRATQDWPQLRFLQNREQSPLMAAAV